MKRSGFTMIELVFVIVILGILAAVAVPKLTATRDDAKASATATDLSQMISDISTYYTANGSFAALSTMSNVSSVDDDTKGAADADVVEYLVGGKKCVKFTFTGSTGTVVTAAGTDAASEPCATINAVSTVSKSIGKTYVLKGTGVTY